MCKIQTIKVTNCKIEVVNTCLQSSNFYTSIDSVQGQIINLYSENGDIDRLDFSNVAYPQFADVSELVTFIEGELAGCNSGTPSFTAEDLENSNYVAYLDNDCDKPIAVTENYQDGVFVNYQVKLLHAPFSRLVLEVSDNARIGFCSSQNSNKEIWKSHVSVLQNGDNLCVSSFLTYLALNGVSNVTGVIGFEFILKPIQGRGRNGFVSTSSQADSTGFYGYRNLDPAGGFIIPFQLKPDGTYVRLEEQCFSTIAGTVAVLNIYYV